MNSEENKESKQKSEDLNNINTITNNKIPLMNNSGKIIMDISNSKSNNRQRIHRSISTCRKLE